MVADNAIDRAALFVTVLVEAGGVGRAHALGRCARDSETELLALC